MPPFTDLSSSGLQPPDLVIRAGQGLYVMTDFVREHVALREFAGRAEAVAQLVEEAEIQVDLVVRGTVEGAARRLREAAGRLNAVAKQHGARLLISTAQQALPRRLRVVHDRIDEVDKALLFRRRRHAGRPHGCRRRRAAGSTAAEQGQEIDTGEPAEEQHDEQPANPQRRPHPQARPAALILDVAAIPGRPFHRLSLRADLMQNRCRRQSTVIARHFP
ncbi:MAG: hypothetical protein A3H96_08460 [Acidobacteria bacterium RIFCSPLOWO2_02_FULL_67_36]|nr:MAG: hypothetical protein A3H96_08460 [Acidobacteria bacterium RIFCSPLOWO2_02_FULL_67_36]